MKTKFWITGCIILFLAVAMIPNPASGDTIFACANKTNGLLRIVNLSPDDCRPHENPISWKNNVVVHGYVTANGDAFAGSSDIGFLVTSHPQPGQYAITFNTALVPAPDCVVTVLAPPVNELLDCNLSTNVSSTGFGVACRSDSLSLVDWSFTFICVQ